MAQTKRKRRSKHRGNAAGTIEHRGRTGRKSPGSDRADKKPETARERRGARLDRAPSWRSALTRGALAAAVFFAAVVALFHQSVPQALTAALLALAIYVPLGYYTDVFIHRRRQKRDGGGGRAAPPRKR